MVMSKNMMWGLVALAAGAGVAMLMPQARKRWQQPLIDDSARVDEASEDSFPASDPPSFSAPAAAIPGPTS